MLDRTSSVRLELHSGNDALFSSLLYCGGDSLLLFVPVSTGLPALLFLSVLLVTLVCFRSPADSHGLILWCQFAPLHNSSFNVASLCKSRGSSFFGGTPSHSINRIIAPVSTGLLLSSLLALFVVEASPLYVGGHRSPSRLYRGRPSQLIP
jgi:hypothetical protein